MQKAVLVRLAAKAVLVATAQVGVRRTLRHSLGRNEEAYT